VFVLGGQVPHHWLFKRCKAVIHHGGASTTAMGLRCGKVNPTPTIISIVDSLFFEILFNQPTNQPTNQPAKTIHPSTDLSIHLSVTPHRRLEKIETLLSSFPSFLCKPPQNTKAYDGVPFLRRPVLLGSGRGGREGWSATLQRVELRRRGDVCGGVCGGV